MTKQEVVRMILGPEQRSPGDHGSAFAAANIALCKYWGKRDEELNLPVTSSLSVSLGEKGTSTTLAVADGADVLLLNDHMIPPDSPVFDRAIRFLDLYRPREGMHFEVSTRSNLPLGAGLASSASAFASLVLALDALFEWELDTRSLSILARLGSGSACRSIQPGFVEWHVGVAPDGMDSYAETLEQTWPALRMGLLKVSEEEKPIGSRPAMRRTVETSRLYEAWPIQVANDLVQLKEAIFFKDFVRLGEAAEANALAMHATMISSRPPVLYWLPETVAALHRVWSLRGQGRRVYFTMDAGPNVKLLFLEEDTAEVREVFPAVEVVRPFGEGRTAWPRL